MSKREPHLLIEDIIESGNKILDYTQGLSFDEFIKIARQLMRYLEILKL